MVAERDRSVVAIENSVEEHNNNQVGAESLKAANDQQKQELARLAEMPKLIMADFQVESKTITS